MGIPAGFMGNNELRTTGMLMEGNWFETPSHSLGGGTAGYNKGLLW